jgi:transposase-like protein
MTQRPTCPKCGLPLLDAQDREHAQQKTGRPCPECPMCDTESVRELGRTMAQRDDEERVSADAWLLTELECLLNRVPVRFDRNVRERLRPTYEAIARDNFLHLENPPWIAPKS